MANISGTNGNDRLRGTGGADVIVARDGDDRLMGGGGDDVLKAGAGVDTLLGGSGDDRAIMTDSDNTAPDSVDGGGGRDTLDLTHFVVAPYPIYWEYDQTSGLFSVGKFGNPEAITFRNVETLLASSEDDTFNFYFSRIGMTLDGGAGDDTISAGDGNDIVYGGLGDDFIGGGDGRNMLYGGLGDDVISPGFEGTGMIDGGRGSDTGSFGGSADLAAGYAINDLGQRVTLVSIENIQAGFLETGAVVRGDDNANIIDATSAREGGTMMGRGGNDQLFGGESDDRLIGGDGADVLNGGLGSDTFVGGAGADTFQYVDDFLLHPDGKDTIEDFSRSEGDRIDLSGLDANTRTEALETFDFIGRSAFHGRAGELRFEYRGGDTFLQTDTDGNSRPDLEIRLTGEIALGARDLILKPDADASFDAGSQVHGATFHDASAMLVDLAMISLV